MPQIFISYRRGPNGYVATYLADEIKRQFGPGTVFMDIDNIPLGVDFRNHLSAAVSECHALLVLIGDDWLTNSLPDGTRRIDVADDFVRIEIEAALQRDIPVIPVITNNARVPLPAELPESLRPLAFRNAAELRSGPDLKAQTQALIRQLSRVCGPEASATRTEPPIPTGSIPRQTTRRTLTIATVALASVVLLSAVVFYLRTRSGSGEKLEDDGGIREVVLQTATDSPILLFKSPDQHSETCGSLRRGSTVLIVENFRGQDGQWWDKISVNPGWLAARNLSDPNSPNLRPAGGGATNLQVGQPAVVSYTGPDGLNLRESPTPQSRVIAYLLGGTNVMITNDKLATADYEWWGAELPEAYMLDRNVDAANHGRAGKILHRPRKR